MKKATLNAVYEALKDIDFDPEVLAEIEAELNKGAEQKAENAKLYDTAKAVVFAELGTTDKAVTIGELFDAVEGNLPEGFTKGKLQYAMTRLWKDELVKVEGKVNAYKRA